MTDDGMGFIQEQSHNTQNLKSCSFNTAASQASVLITTSQHIVPVTALFSLQVVHKSELLHIYTKRVKKFRIPVTIYHMNVSIDKEILTSIQTR